MANVELTRQELTSGGLAALTFTNLAVADTMFVNNADGLTAVVVDNGGSLGTITVTIETPGTVDGNAIADATLVVTNTNIGVRAGLIRTVYNQANSGLSLTAAVQLDTDVEATPMAAFKMETG